MAETTGITWTDSTFNPWIGCNKVAPGCANCYAEADMDHRRHFAKWGLHGTRVKTSEANWRKPVKWNKEAEAAGVRRRVFCSSLADVFEDWKGPIQDTNGDTLHKAEPWQRGEGYVPLDLHIGKSAVTMADLRVDLFRLIDQTPNLDWLLLTKRPENIRRMWGMMADKRPIFPGAPGALGQPVDCLVADAYRKNVWLGTSISDQETANKAIGQLVRCRNLAPVLFLSIEPLLGPVALTRIDNGGGETYNVLTARVTNERGHSFGTSDTKPVDWVIVGGESGPNARPCNLEWIDDIKEQCRAAGVPCFIKQLGANVVQPTLQGKTIPVRFEDRKGGDPEEWPEDLRVREFPLTRQ